MSKPAIVPSPSYAERLAALRARLKAAGVDGFLVPRADEYQGEYVPSCAERLRWISGFTGSAGYAVILMERAGVFSDGRYTIQLRTQVDPALFTVGDSTKVGMAAWIGDNAPKGAVIGYDPKLHTVAAIAALVEKGIALKALDENPLDAVWTDRPAPPSSPVSLFPADYAGESVESKRARVAAEVVAAGGDVAILSLPDSIAWLLNIRGEDIAHIPVALSYALIHRDGSVDWFIDPARVGADVRAALGGDVRLVLPTQMEAVLRGVKGQNILLDERRSGQWFADVIAAAGGSHKDLKDPCIALKARKNQAEIAAMRAAHVRDGVAVSTFLAWLEEEAPKGGLDELGVEAKLEEFRRESNLYRDSSFDTIAGFGGNGAIVHYRATPATNKVLTPGNLLLLDSGAQYADGTTDITRTIAIGEPSREMREHFTLVLKGHIALATARFPAGTTGAQVDVLARSPLWQRGLDYAHGTGHGVGVYLSVHEESASISPRGHEPLEEGMILSNEPGYYREGAYGIRIENLLLVKKDGICADTGKEMLSFETLTLAPIDPALVDFDLLNDDERAWLRGYHAEIKEKIGPRLDDVARAFLDKTISHYV